ncbi:hypothetical protein VPH35_059753 [Triticum aestivum]
MILGKVPGGPISDQFLCFPANLLFLLHQQLDVNLLWEAVVHQGARQQRHVHSTLKDELLLFLMLAPCCRYTSLLTSPKISSWSRQLHMMKPLILVVGYELCLNMSARSPNVGPRMNSTLELS